MGSVGAEIKLGPVSGSSSNSSSGSGSGSGSDNSSDSNSSSGSIIRTLFNESQSKIVVSAGKNKLKDLIKICKKFEIPFMQLGTTGGAVLKINGLDCIEIKEAQNIYDSSMGKIMSL